VLGTTQHEGDHLPGVGIDAKLRPAFLKERAAFADRLRSRTFSLTASWMALVVSLGLV
jgi:hypothetical protein